MTDPPYLDWSSPGHLAQRHGRCRHCGGRTRLRDDDGNPSHKVCAEEALAGRPPVQNPNAPQTIGGL